MTKSSRGKELIPRAVRKIINELSREWIDWQTAANRLDEYYRRHRIKRRRLVRLHGDSHHQIISVVKALAAGETLRAVADKISSSDDDRLRLVERIKEQFYEAALGKPDESFVDRAKRRQEYERALNDGMKPENRVKVCVDGQGVATLLTQDEIFAMLDERFSPEKMAYLNELVKK